jgi:hypothetical protein
MFFIIALGALLPTMHQSSMGSLMISAGYKVHPLWQSYEMLPLFSVLTAFIMGFSIVIFEGSLVQAGLRGNGPDEKSLFVKLTNTISVLLAIFIVLRFGELIYRDKLSLAFAGDFYSVMFWIEVLLMLFPLVTENEYRVAKPETIVPKSFEEARQILPNPIWGGHDKELEMYWKAWEIAIGNIRAPQAGSGFVSSYLDTAYNGNIFMWDSSFILMFARSMIQTIHNVFPETIILSISMGMVSSTARTKLLTVTLILHRIHIMLLLALSGRDLVLLFSSMV